VGHKVAAGAAHARDHFPRHQWFLAINGYGAWATKILRSLYERAVTIDYLILSFRLGQKALHWWPP
jgi:hypothetical protein